MATQPQTEHVQHVSQQMPSILFSSGRAAHIAGDDDLYGWLVGGWALDVIDYLPDGGRRTSSGEVHFAWVLEGRAIQDVWIMPRIAERRIDTPLAGNRYGTTIRVYDAPTRTWRVTWINPVTGAHNQLVGRRQGGEIVQDGVRPDGERIRWRFVDIRPDAFRWLGESSPDDGATWRLEAEFHARRTSTQPLR